MQKTGKKFREIVKLGRKSEFAELAYGELFALASRATGDQELAKLWRAYLRRFPGGRYADGARAGLCRRAGEDTRTQCWTDYLDKHPRGSARGEALRATD